MFVKEIIKLLEEWAPKEYSEEFDNVGLLTGDLNVKCSGVLITLDTIETIIDEAIMKKCNLIVSFHPIIFSGLKKITGSNYVQRTIIKAIQNNIAIYALHTALDNYRYGVNHKIAQKLNLTNTAILIPKNRTLKKIITNIPSAESDILLEALYDLGARPLGEDKVFVYKSSMEEKFKKGNDISNLIIGKPLQKKNFKETQIQLVFQKHLEKKILNALNKNNPSEKITYDIISIDNTDENIGMGMVGELKKSMNEIEFISFIKSIFKIPFVRHSKLLSKSIKKVSVLGGSGSFAIDEAIKQKSDVFLTADIKYHQFFKSEDNILLIDIGHYESEQFTKKLIYDYLKEKLTSFAVVLSSTKTNPVNYS